MEIVTATLYELPAIRQIARECWPDAYTGIIPQEQIDYMLKKMYSINSLEKQMQEEDCDFLLAKEEKKYIGFASYSQLDTSRFKLHKLYLLSTQKGRGVGKILLDEVCKRIIEAGGKTLELQVNKKNPAKSFYIKNGFEISSELVLDIGNGFVMDDYIMIKHL